MLYLSRPSTQTHPIFLLHADPHSPPPHSQKNTQPNTQIWRYHLDRWPATQTWPACPLACSLPPSLPPYLPLPTPPTTPLLNRNQFRSAGKPQMNMHSEPAHPTLPHLPFSYQHTHTSNKPSKCLSPTALSVGITAPTTQKKKKKIGLCLANMQGNRF